MGSALHCPSDQRGVCAIAIGYVRRWCLRVFRDVRVFLLALWVLQIMGDAHIMQDSAGCNNIAGSVWCKVEHPIALEAHLEDSEALLNTHSRFAVGFIVCLFFACCRCPDRRHQPRFQWVPEITCMFQQIMKMDPSFIKNVRCF